jgi:hypothetical protein
MCILTLQQSYIDISINEPLLEYVTLYFWSSTGLLV